MTPAALPSAGAATGPAGPRRPAPACACGRPLDRPLQRCPACGRPIDRDTTTRLVAAYLARGRSDDPWGLAGDDLAPPPAVLRRGTLGRALVAAWVAAIRAYQRRLSRFTGTCVYFPSCSDYAALAARRFGVARAARLTAARLLRCHHPHGGVDFPPDA